MGLQKRASCCLQTLMLFPYSSATVDVKTMRKLSPPSPSIVSISRHTKGNKNSQSTVWNGLHNLIIVILFLSKIFISLIFENVFFVNFSVLICFLSYQFDVCLYFLVQEYYKFNFVMFVLSNEKNCPVFLLLFLFLVLDYH